MKSRKFDSLTVFEDGTVKLKDLVKKVSIFNNNPVFYYNQKQFKLVKVMASLFLSKNQYDPSKGDCVRFKDLKSFHVNNLEVYNRRKSNPFAFKNKPVVFNSKTPNANCEKCLFCRSYYLSVHNEEPHLVCTQLKQKLVIRSAIQNVECQYFKEEKEKKNDPQGDLNTLWEIPDTRIISETLHAKKVEQSFKQIIKNYEMGAV